MVDVVKAVSGLFAADTYFCRTQQELTDFCENMELSRWNDKKWLLAELTVKTLGSNGSRAYRHVVSIWIALSLPHVLQISDSHRRRLIVPSTCWDWSQIQ